MEITELYKIYQEHPTITTDSRDCPKGSIFLALKGASFDGNKFAKMALRRDALMQLSMKKNTWLRMILDTYWWKIA